MIKTPEVCLELEDPKDHTKYFNVIKFEIHAPKSTACEIDAKILIWDNELKNCEQLIMFNLQIY